MLSTILRTIAAHGLFRAGDRVVIAVSGGPDSMALLHALWELGDRLGLTLEVAAVDHGLRAEAAREVDLVRERAAALGLAFSALAVDAAAARREGRASLQDAARRVRLGALAELAAAHGAAAVALGHQADDQAETVLQRIIRGTGLDGLRGIPYRRAPFVRPLLDVRRSEVLRYLARRSIPFVEDPSNADPRFARARLRHRILPALREENPRVAEALVGLAAAARAGRRGAPGVPADIPASIGRRAAAVVERLKARGGSGGVDVAGGRRLEVNYGAVRLARPPRAPAEAPRDALVVIRPGRYPWSPGGAVQIRLRASTRSGGAPERPGAPGFDADRVAWPLVLRGRRPGDRMRPRGGRGSRKLSDLMIDAKIARGARAGLPVLAAADGVVLFVPGLRPAEAGRPTPATRRLLSVRFDPPVAGLRADRDEDV
jgi:tRNA(Ile)-lysidine synthase